MLYMAKQVQQDAIIAFLFSAIHRRPTGDTGLPVQEHKEEAV